MNLLIPLLLLAPLGCSHLVEHHNAGIGILEEAPVPIRPIARASKYAGWMVSTPLVLAAMPIAALAWATPWVDLPLAADLATAPSIGIGYAWRALWVSRSTAHFPGSRGIRVRTDPLLLAPYVDPRKVLLFIGAWNVKVPVETGLDPREAMGRPETYILAGNHESASLCFGFLLHRAEEFFGGEDPPEMARPREDGAAFSGPGGVAPLPTPW